MTDIDKTLEVLRNAKEKGVHSFHLNALVGTTRSAARINDLKELGYVISSKPEVMGSSRGVRYFLHENNPVHKEEFTWEFKDGVAKKVRVLKEPIQEALL